MADEISRALARDGDLADGETLAEFEQRAIGHEAVPGWRLAQKIE